MEMFTMLLQLKEFLSKDPSPKLSLLMEKYQMALYLLAKLLTVPLFRARHSMDLSMMPPFNEEISSMSPF